eukprot:TRINITY_DN10127_c0_g1_i1.p1 TRINITY_DN10127_c0_g1~~TRINITY_DN10127_c0_g1_i1.p1  ORF type:complete len:466 (+),score=123.68 TRINITY_DN10127_c0_g1_i1:182-1399(+)
MPVPFMAGFALVTKVSGAAGIAFALGDVVAQVGEVSTTLPERVTARRGLRRTRAGRESAKQNTRVCLSLQRGVGACDVARVFKSFAVGTAVGTVGGTAFTILHGVSTTAVPLTKVDLLQGLLIAGASTTMWLPYYVLLTRNKDEELEEKVPEHFLNGLLAGVTLFVIPSVLRWRRLSASCTAITAPFEALLLMVFVNEYAWMQAHKRAPDGRELGPMVGTASRWLIAAGVCSGNLLVIALIVTPFYHPGHFLVWGITNPALMYTMSIMAEAEIESAQMERHLHAVGSGGQRVVDPDQYMQRRLVRAMLPLLGLPFAYVADREDVQHFLKIGLAGLGAVGLGVIVATFQDEWTALLKDTYEDIRIDEITRVSSPMARRPSMVLSPEMRRRRSSTREEGEGPQTVEV